MEYQRPQTNLKIAIPLVLCAAIANAFMILLVKLAAESLSVPLILFARYLITLLIVLPFLYFNTEKKPFSQMIQTRRFPLHLFRDVFGFIGLYSYFYATKFITLADATVLFNTAPLFIPLIALFWQKLKIFHRLWIGLGTGFLGVILLLHPGREVLQIAAAIGLFAGFCSALVIVAGRLLTYSEPPIRTLFYYFVTGTLLSFIVLIFQTPHFWQGIHLKEFLLLLGVGLFGYFYQFFVTTSTKYAPVRLTSPILYVSVIISLFFDWLIWKQIPDSYAAIGICLIILGAILLLVLYPKEDYQKR